MKSTIFYKTNAKSPTATQGVKRRVRPRLSREALQALNLRRRQSAANYRKALGDAWSKFDEISQDLATSHRKSLQHVQKSLYIRSRYISTKKTSAWNAFCWKKGQEKENGKCIQFFRLYITYLFSYQDPISSSLTGKQVLQHLVSAHQEEYEALTTEERKALIKEFEQEKATKATARRISMKARVNDVTETTSAVENAVSFLFTLL